MLIDFGAKSIDQPRLLFRVSSVSLRVSTGVSQAGSVPAPNPRNNKTPQVTDYKRNASHYEFHDPAREVGKIVKKSDDCRVVLTNPLLCLGLSQPALSF